MKKGINMRYTFLCDKLVRDKDPQLMAQRHIETKTSPITGDTLISYLKQKIQEEASEVVSARTLPHMLDELVDVVEAAQVLLRVMGVTEEEFQHLCQEKRHKRGTYEAGVHLYEVSLTKDNPEVKHYLAHPEKYKISEV